jgi:ABC-type multidrug transport system fused ATPase/permease subunit
MLQPTWGFSHWLLIVLAAVVLGAYFGVLGPVQEALEDKIEVIEKKIEQRLDKRQAALRMKLEKLGNQPKVQEKFVDSETAWAEAAVVLALFIFLTPIAVVMALVLIFFLCAAIAHMLPLPEAIPHKAAVAALLIVLALATFVVRDRWVPYAQYYAGWVAKAYLVATASS